MKQNYISRRIRGFFFSILFLLFLSNGYSQTSQGYTMQTGNFTTNARTVNTNSNYFAGSYNNSASEVGFYANGSGGGYTGDPGVASFQTFTTNGVGSGTARPLKVGDQFAITCYVGNSSSFFTSSNSGISFNGVTTSTSFSDFSNTQRAKFQINQGGNWFPKAANTGSGFATPGQDVTFTIKLTSANTAIMTVSTANGATTYDMILANSPATSGDNIVGFAIWNQTSGTGNDMYWKNGLLTSTGTVELGNGNGTSTISGVISNGLAATSTSTLSTNTVTKSGSGTITLTAQNTYTGLTTVSAGTLQLSRTGGTTIPTTNNCTVSGGMLQISSDQTIANLDLSGGGSLTVDVGVTLTVTGTYTGGTGTITNNGTIILQGSSSQTFPGASATISAMKNLTIDNSTGVTLNKDITFSNSGTLTVNANKIFTTGTQVISFGTSGTTTINGTLQTANTNGFSGASNTTIANTNTPTITLGSSSTIEYNSTSAQAITARTDYANLTLSTTATVTKTLTSSGVFTLSGNFVVSSPSSGTITVNGGSATLNLAGNYTHIKNGTGSFSYSAGAAFNLILTGSGAQTITTGSGQSLYLKDLDINVTGSKSGTTTLAANTNIYIFRDFKANLTGSGNQFSDGGNTIFFSGFSGASTCNLAGNAAGYNFTGTILNNQIGTGLSFRDNGTNTNSIVAALNNVSLGTSPSVTFQTANGGTVTIKGYLNIGSSAGTITFGTGTAGIFQIGGDYTNSETTANTKLSGVTFNFNGTAAQTITSSVTGGETFNNLTISNTAASVIAGSSTPITVNNALSINSGGTLDMATNALTGSSLTTSGTGTLKTQNTGTALPSSRTWSMAVQYNANGAQNIAGGTYSNGLTCSNSSIATKTMAADATVSGALTLSTSKLAIGANTLTLNGTVSGMSGSNSLVGSNSSKLTVTSTTSAGTVYFDQTTSADAGTTTGTNALQNLVVSGSGGSVTLGNKVNLLERLSVSAGTLNTGDALVFRSISGTSSNNTAYVDQVSGTISGQVTVERYVHKQSQGWRAITAPVTYNGISQGYVSGNWQSNFGFSGNYGTRITGPSATNGIDDVTVSASLMTYNSTSGAWNKVTNTNTETMAGANGNADNKGFFLFVRGDRTVTPNGYNPNAFVATTLAAKGKLQTGTQTFSYGGAANKAWLVGNPYACTVDMSTATFNGSIPNFVYVWDPNRPSSYSGVTGAYVTFDRTSWGAPTAGTTTKYFQSGECFFVVPTSASGVSVVFNESNKNISNQNNQTAGSANGLSDEFNIKLSYIKTDGSKAEIDGIRAKFGASYSTLVDADDAYKWSSADIENMSLVRNNANLVIEARPHITSTDSLFLNITNLSIGSNYEFKLNPVNFDASVSSCKLVDKFLNTETPISLTNTTLVNFNVSSVTGSNAAGRFYVVFNAAGSLPTSNSLTVKAYKQNNNNIKIDWEAIAENNVKTYTVEKSTDAASFSKLSEATAKNGNTTNAYSIVDNNPVIGVNYYRIQSVQTNNNKAYSTIVRVEMSDKGIKSITVYPNPVKSSSNAIGLQMNNLTAGSYTAVLYNTAGQQVWMNTMNHNGSNGSTSLQLNKTLASGTYQLQLTDSKGNSYKQTVLVVE